MTICGVDAVMNARFRTSGQRKKTQVNATACLNATGWHYLTDGYCRKTLLTLIQQGGVSLDLSIHVNLPALKESHSCFCRHCLDPRLIVAVMWQLQALLNTKLIRPAGCGYAPAWRLCGNELHLPRPWTACFGTCSAPCAEKMGPV